MREVVSLNKRLGIQLKMEREHMAKIRNAQNTAARQRARQVRRNTRRR